MKKRLFVVSDVHGHYTGMKTALDKAGFDPNNEKHIFLSCGDLFDRGKENTNVYDFVCNLKQKILLKGNHEDILNCIFERGHLEQTDFLNETDITVKQLLGSDAIDFDGRLNSVKYAEKIKEIKSFIDGMADYYETADYVFTHGWLPITFDDRTAKVDLDWKSASKADWIEARLLEWQQLYSVGAGLKDKTIVCGHRPSYLGRMFDSFRDPDSSEIFYGDGLIAIDAYTVRSGRVNVFVIDVE